MLGGVETGRLRQPGRAFDTGICESTLYWLVLEMSKDRSWVWQSRARILAKG